MKIISSWLDKKVTNPKTNNLVKVKSLPLEERKKYRPKSLKSRAQEGDEKVLNHPDLTKNNKNEDTPLHHLSRAGVVKILDHPEAGTLKGSQQRTPLHSFAQSSNLTLPKVKKLLQHPAVSTVKDKHGNTPLHLLANNPTYAPQIVEHQSATIKNNNDITPLHKAGRAGSDAILNHPEAFTLKDMRGETPAHKLARSINDLAEPQKGYTKRKLLNHPKAHVVKNIEGKTPADLI